MNALLVDLANPMVAGVAERQWTHVDRTRSRLPRSRQVARGCAGRAGVRSAPTGRPCGVAAPTLRARSRVAGAAASSLQLTRRGLAVIVSAFLLLMAVSVVVLVASFLSVSNDPPATTAAAAGQGAGF